MTRVPEWLRHTVRIRAVPMDRTLVARGVVGMLVPLALGQAAGRPDLGAAAALGAYGAAVDDSSAPWRTRASPCSCPSSAARSDSPWAGSPTDRRGRRSCWSRWLPWSRG